MQSRAFHTKQMAGSGVAAAFNWDSPAASTQSSAAATWGSASFGAPTSYSSPLIADTGVHKKGCTSVREVAANVDKNAAYRPYMEDGRLAFLLLS